MSEVDLASEEAASGFTQSLGDPAEVFTDVSFDFTVENLDTSQVVMSGLKTTVRTVSPTVSPSVAPSSISPTTRAPTHPGETFTPTAPPTSAPTTQVRCELYSYEVIFFVCWDPQNYVA